MLRRILIGIIRVFLYQLIMRPLTRGLYRLLSVAALLALTACGSGGGGGSAPSITPTYTPTGTVNTSGGNGLAAMYGFNTVNTDIQNYTNPGVTFNFPTKGAINITDPLTNKAEYLVYQPTCISAGQERYSMVLVSGTGPQTISLERTASTMVRRDWAYLGDSSRVVIPPDINYATTCSSGKVTVDVSKEFYANGTFAVYSDNGDIYYGIRDTLLVTSGAFASKAGTAFTYFKGGAELINAGNTQIGDYGEVVSKTMTNNKLPVFNFQAEIKFVSTLSAYHSATNILMASGNYGAMKGIAGNIGGKVLILSVYAHDDIGGFSSSDTDCFWDGVNAGYYNCNGIGHALVWKEN